MSFKDMVAADIHNVFLNTDAFAEARTVVYDGEIYENIPVSLQKNKLVDRPRVTATGSGRGGSDSAAGLYLVTHVMHCAKTDIGDAVPEQGKTLKIKSLESDYFQKYDIVSSGCKMGMLRLELRNVK